MTCHARPLALRRAPVGGSRPSEPAVHPPPRGPVRGVRREPGRSGPGRGSAGALAARDRAEPPSTAASDRSALRELRRPPRLPQPVLLAFDLARVARQETVLAEDVLVGRIVALQRARDA